MKKPIYLLAGGNWRQPGALTPWFRMILAETRMPVPKVAYVGAANGDDPAFFKFGRTWFASAGAEVEQVLLTGARPDMRRAKSVLRRSDAVFISGGDVDAGMRCLTQCNLVSFLQELHAGGTLFFGLSAGSIMLGTRWIRWANDADDSTAELFDCMGLAPVMCDTHGEGDRWAELMAAVRLLKAGGKGYGIPAGGALRISPSGRLAALAHPVMCYQNRGGQKIAASKLSVSWRTDVGAWTT